jgi:hypothetical protein
VEYVGKGLGANIPNFNHHLGTFVHFITLTPPAQALAIDEAKYEVRVNTLSPGNVWTPLWESCANQGPIQQNSISAETFRDTFISCNNG